MTNSLGSIVGTSATDRRDEWGVVKISLRSGVIMLRGSESDREFREDPGGVMDP